MPSGEKPRARALTWRRPALLRAQHDAEASLRASCSTGCLACVATLFAAVGALVGVLLPVSLAPETAAKVTGALGWGVPVLGAFYLSLRAITLKPLFPCCPEVSGGSQRARLRT